MSSSSEENSTEAVQPHFMTAASLENLVKCREAMYKNYIDFNERTKDFEIADLRKYKILSNLKETINFENDSEDLGIAEDLAILNIK